MEKSQLATEAEKKTMENALHTAKNEVVEKNNELEKRSNLNREQRLEQNATEKALVKKTKDFVLHRRITAHF